MTPKNVNTGSGLRAKIASLFGWSFGGSGPSTWEFAKAWLRGRQLVMKGAMVDPYEQHAITQTAIKTFYRAASSIALEVFPEGHGKKTENPILDHPILKVWKRPNPYMAGNQLFQMLYLHRALYGEHIWYYPDLTLPKPGMTGNVARAATGGHIEILDPRKVKNEIKNGRMVWFEERSPGNERPLDPDYLTIFKELDPNNLARGMSMMGALLPEASSDHAALSWNKAFFENGAMPSAFIKPDIDTAYNRDQFREWLRSYNEGQSGGKQRSVGMLLPGHDIVDMSSAHRDMEFERLRFKSEENILGLIGVPPFLAGRMENANYANAREQRHAFWFHTIKPVVDDTLAVINNDFFPKMGIEGEVFAKWEAVMAILDDQALKSEVGKRYFDMGVPVEEINKRLELGYDPTKIPASKTGFLPGNLVNTEKLKDVDPSARPAQIPGAPPEPGRKDKNPDKPNQPDATLAAQQNERTRLLDMTFTLEQKFNKVIRSHMQSLSQEVEQNMAQLAGWRHRAGVAAPSTLLFDLDAANRKLRRTTKPLFEKAVKDGGDSVYTETGVPIPPGVDPTSITLVGTKTFQITRINATINRKLNQVLSDSMSGKVAIDEVRNEVNKVMKAGLGRSRLIARTEVGAAFNEARTEAMKKAGVKRHQWITSLDQDVRDAHVDIGIHGQIVYVGEVFKNGLRFPQDPAGPVAEVANCRCVALSVVEARRPQ